MKPADELVVLAEDNDTYQPEDPTPLSVKDLQTFVAPPKHSKPELVLVMGWLADIRDMIMLLDALVAPGSELHILCNIKIKVWMENDAPNRGARV